MAKLLSQTGMTLVAQVADHVRGRIVREQLKRGVPLPSYRDLVDELGVACLTVKRGMDQLVKEGVIYRQHGRGTYVAKELAPAPRELKHIGVILPASRTQLFLNTYMSEIMRGIAERSPSGSDMHIFSLREDGLVDAAQLGKWDVHGVILLGVENDDYLRAFAQWGTPGVAVDYCSQAAPLDYVACDNRAAARAVVAHVHALGHRRVAYAAPSSQTPVVRPEDWTLTLLMRDSSDMRERQDETAAALRERGMQADEWILPGKDWAGRAAVDLRSRLGSGDRPTALLTDSNYSANVLVRELARQGLRVPEDVSVCAVASDGVDGAVGARLLTCCRFDFVGMGREAIDLLMARCRAPGLNEAREHRIGFEFVEGQTAGRANPS